MQTMTRNQWIARTIAKKDQLGGDLWNADNIWRKAFAAAPEARMVGYDYIGTGLWVDVTIWAPGGTTTRRIFG